MGPVTAVCTSSGLAEERPMAGDGDATAAAPRLGLPLRWIVKNLLQNASAAPAANKPQVYRGRKAGTVGYTIAEVNLLLEACEEIRPIGAQQWEAEAVHTKMAKHASGNKVKAERTTESHKVKFMTLVNDKKPTGDPKCPGRLSLKCNPVDVRVCSNTSEVVPTLTC